MTEINCMECFEDGMTEEIYKIQRQSSVDKQHIIIGETFTYYMYRPYCHGNLPIFTIGNNQQNNPAAVGDTVAVMTGGVIEGPVQLGVVAQTALGDTVYMAWDGTTPYLTVDPSDTDIVCCWGIIIDDQRPIYYGTVRPSIPVPIEEENEPYSLLQSIKMIQPACGSIEGRVQ